MSEDKIGEFVGKSFEDGGRGPDSYDCWGLVKDVFSSFGIEVPDYKISCFASKEIDSKIEECKRQWIRLDKPEVPCLVVIKADPNVPRACTHCGVYVLPGKFLHAQNNRGSILTPTNHPYWKTRIVGYYKWNGSKS